MSRGRGVKGSRDCGGGKRKRTERRRDGKKASDSVKGNGEQDRRSQRRRQRLQWTIVTVSGTTSGTWTTTTGKYSTALDWTLFSAVMIPPF